MNTLSREKDHPKGIWTWRRSKGRAGKATLYIPYLQSIEKIRGGYRVSFNGGFLDVRLRDVDCILLYGASGSIPAPFLDDLSKHRIPLIIHRRNMSMPYFLLPSTGNDGDDILTRQILARQDGKKRAYIARTLVRERLDSMQWLIGWPDKDRDELKQARNLASVRAIEAKHTNRYWKAYYRQLGLENVTRRNDPHPVNKALDAASVFTSAIILRWLIYHRLSPAHGFLHEPTGYPALVYDLIEPYRAWFEQAVAEAWTETSENKMEAASIAILSQKLDEDIYVHATRQIAMRKNILHGVVLALREYLLCEAGKGQRFVIPVEGEKIGGRPMKVGYSIPGGVKA